jgi:hypothetical protein
MSVAKILKLNVREKSIIITNNRIRNCRKLLSYLEFQYEDINFITNRIGCDDNSSILGDNENLNIYSDLLKLVVYQNQVYKLLKINHLSQIFKSYWRLDRIHPLLIITKDDVDQNIVDYRLDNKMKDSLLKHLLLVNSTFSDLVTSYEKCDNYDSFESDLFYRFILDLLGHKQDKIILQ